MKVLQSLINAASNDLLSEKIGSVFQIWEDGEITMQKCGDLLWKRRLHTIKPAISNIELDIEMEMPHKRGAYSFAFVTRENAEVIREEIKKEVIRKIQIS